VILLALMVQDTVARKITLLVACCGVLAGCGNSATGGPTDASIDHPDAESADADARAPTDAADARSRADAADARAALDAADAHPPTDGRAPSDASDSGPSACGDGGYLFCDDFEEGLTRWTQTYVSGGRVTTDSTHVYQGKHALHAHVDAVTDAGASAYAYVQQIQNWPKHVFARFFVYRPSPLPPSSSAVLDLVQEFSPYAGIELLTEPRSGDLAMKTYSTAHDQAWASDSGAVTPSQWICFELEVDSSTETSHLYLNGTEVTDLAQTKLGLPQLGILGVGLSFYLPKVQGAEDDWIDNVAVNGARIGCM
jgi:hypothetical protein